jgi:hypothetical protein
MESASATPNPRRAPPDRRRAFLCALIAAALGAAIWALSIPVTGKAEPWDSNGPYYLVALAAAGLISGATMRDHLVAQYVGVIVGQALYELLFLPMGALFVLGLAFLAGYSVIFLGAAAAAASIRRRLAAR